MKKNVIVAVALIAGLCAPLQSHAQSFKDLFNKENISKVVKADSYEGMMLGFETAKGQ